MREGETPPKFGNFVGRDRELGELRHGLDETLQGRGRLFLISGEPGIGKTRFAEEIAREAGARGMLTVWGRCWEGGGAPAYWPWIQVIRGCLNSTDLPQRRAVLESEHAASTVEAVAQIVPELHAFAARSLKPAIKTADSAPTQFRLFDAVATLLKDFARPKPLVILLDDLHDADFSSLTMLQFVARELAGAPILIVGTYRPAEVQRSPALSKHVGDLSREGRSISLRGLSQAEVAEFVGLSSGQAPDDQLVLRLHAATAGNPLFVDGILRTLIADRDPEHMTASGVQFKIPHTLREAIGRRLATLSDEAQSLLKVAATIGDEFEAAICTQAGEVSREQFNSLLDEASIAGIVIPLGTGRFRFAHALIRSALYEALDTNARMRLHGKIAEAIEQIHAKDLSAHSAELALHFRAAGVSDRAIKYSNRAAKAANAVFAFAVAATHWREALALSEGQNDLRRADMLFSLGNVTSFHLDPAQGVAFLEAALSLYRELKNEEKVAGTNAILGLALTSAADFAPEMDVPRALQHFRQAQEWKGEWTSLLALGWLYEGMALALFQRVRIDEAFDSAMLAMQTWRRASNPAWVVAASQGAQQLVIKGRHREAAALFDEVRDFVQEVADPESFRSAMWYAGWCHMTMRDPIEAKRFFTIGMERRGLSAHQRTRHLEFLAMVELLAGDLAQAKALAAEHRVNPSFRSAIAFREGDWEAAIEMQLPMLEWARRTGHLWDVVSTLAGLFDFIRLTGDLERATDILQQGLRAYQPSDLFLEMFFRPQAVLLALEAGRPEEATRHMEVCRAIVAQGEDWLGRAGLVDRAEGVLASAQGGDFTPHFEKAIAIFKRFSLPWDVADTLDYWGRALLAAGNSSQANEKFDAAIEIYRRHGAGQRWIDRVEQARARSLGLARAVQVEVTSSPSAAESIFRKDGDFWTITHQGKTFRLRNLKGLEYIAYLLAHPGVRIHARDLVAMIEGAETRGSALSPKRARAEGLEAAHDLGDAGEALDPQAVSAYRRRLTEVREEIAEAERNHDTGAIERARHEHDLLTGQLSAAVGRGGRIRRSSSHVERARAAVTKNIRAGVERIQRNDPQLGEHLASSIRTGAFCAYLPTLEDQPSWQK